MARAVMVILGLIAAIGWSVAWKSISFGVKLMSQRDEARAALQRFGDLPDDDGVFLRVHADALRSVLDWVRSQPDWRWTLDAGDVDYLQERLRTVTR